jgi:hypothetical protein
MPTLEVPLQSDLHRQLVRRLESRLKMSIREQTNQHDIWMKAEERCLAFLPESSADQVRRNKREIEGSPTFTTIQIPYSYALLMSAHTYWTSVFFARSPVHQFSGRHGEAEMQIQALEALIGYQTETGGALGPYYIWLYDSGKYGAGILGHYWCVEKLHYGSLVEMTNPQSGRVEMFQTTQEIQGYVGNKCYNVAPYDFLHDPRVTLRNFQKGEFCATRARMGWNDILRRRDAKFFNSNVDILRSSAPATGSDNQGASVLVKPHFTTLIYDDDAVGHPAGAVFWEVYVNLVPREWGVGQTNYPQIWCFTITDDYRLIVGATPVGNWHCQFPFDVIVPEVEGYGLWGRGLIETTAGVQNTIDWLLNTHFFNVRATLNNQFIIDPSKIVIKDVMKGGPGFVWRLRPEAYGSDLSKIFMQVPVSDVTQSNFADFQMMLGIGERITGVNDQIMGTLNPGGRKTATEIRTSTGFGVNRQKTITEFISATSFSPHAQKLVQSSQQFYDASAKLRIVGSFAQDAGPQFLQVTPEMIAGFFDFVPVDGTLPIDRMAQANLWKEIMGSLRMMPPQIMAAYDWNRVFGWVAQLGGLKNIYQFKVQVVPDAQLAQQAASGNVIPMPPRPGLPSPVAPGNAASTQAGLESMGGADYGSGALPGY